MNYDQKLANLFLQNFNESYRSAKHLIFSFESIKPLIPLSAQALDGLNPAHMVMLDAFRVRFCDLQASLGNKVFRTLCIFEEEAPGTNLDIINKMEKRGIIDSFEQWKELRNIRNLFSHDYPETTEHRANIINTAYSHVISLVGVLDKVIAYTRLHLHLNMDRFPFLLKRSDPFSAIQEIAKETGMELL